MTKSILTFVDETRRKCWWLTKSQLFFFSKLVCTSLVECCPVLYLSLLHSLRCPDRHASDPLWLNVMMAEVQALGTGRKIRIDIWTLFYYTLTENKTQCSSITGEKPCGFIIGGKNTTNLKRHPKAYNPVIYATVNLLVTVNDN